MSPAVRWEHRPHPAGPRLALGPWKPVFPSPTQEVEPPGGIVTSSALHFQPGASGVREGHLPWPAEPGAPAAPLTPDGKGQPQLLLLGHPLGLEEAAPQRLHFDLIPVTFRERAKCSWQRVEHGFLITGSRGLGGDPRAPSPLPTCPPILSQLSPVAGAQEEREEGLMENVLPWGGISTSRLVITK